MGVTLEWSEDIGGRGKTYVLRIPTVDMAMAVFDNFDRALFEDIDTSDDVTIADRLLGLETMVRRIEQSSESEPKSSPIPEGAINNNKSR